MKTRLKDIPVDHPLFNSLKILSNDIRLFIELSLQETESSWEEWVPLILKELEVKCWERKKCTKKHCPAYMNAGGRCWLVAGTMCGGKIVGEFALKYKNCAECDVYQEAVYKTPISEVYEHLVTLVHNMKFTQDKLKTMATRDLLTGTYNRNYFIETIAMEIEKSKRYGDKISIIVIDVDNFKKLNDLYGHVHGDGVLKECALILNKAIRASDLLCRYGGDEFILVIPRSDCRKNEALIRRIEKYVAQWNKEYASKDYELSFSIGCAVWEKGKTLPDVINEADKAMYQTKIRRKKAAKSHIPLFIGRLI